MVAVGTSGLRRRKLVAGYGRPLASTRANAEASLSGITIIPPSLDPLASMACTQSRFSSTVRDPLKWNCSAIDGDSQRLTRPDPVVGESVHDK